MAIMEYINCIFTKFMETIKELNQDTTNILNAYGGFLEDYQTES
jgi:hypothetical protein